MTERASPRPRRRPPRGCVCWLALGLGLSPALGSEAASRAAQTASAGRPDRSLYQDAREAQARLRGSARLQARQGEWERVVLLYRRVVARYPQSPYCDNALLAVGDLYRDMAARFGGARYRDDALRAYRSLVAEYPSSSLGEGALFAALQLNRGSAGRKPVADAAREYLEAFPDGRRAPQVKALLKRDAPAQASALPKPPPPGLAQVFNLRLWSGDASTRVVIDVQREVPILSDRIADPERLWIDLKRARLHPNLKDRTFPVGNGLLQQVRIAQNQDDVVRVVLDFEDVKSHNVFYLHDPDRLVIDVQGTPVERTKLASTDAGTPLSPTATPRPAPSTLAAAEVVDETQVDVPPAELPGREPEPDRLPVRRIAATLPRPASSVADGRRKPSPVELDSAAFERRRARPEPVRSTAPPAPVARAETRAPEPPAAPQPNRSGSISLARQLGLGARRIVIDAGHGGHDPGTIGRGGLQEKDLVLDVALRLERMLRGELGAEVLLTRPSDVFIPLEERTAIANSRGADLFLSIHANSSRNPRARGIETYFLNFARHSHAAEVAARENAISEATLKDLQGLVKAIALNSKIDESRDFAASVQEALVGELREHYRDVVDRGVHTAPFYVLIGANMPSVLAEIAFVSHPDEEKRLKTPECRERIARSLLAGVRRYLDELSRTHMQKLTGSDRRSTVGPRARR